MKKKIKIAVVGATGAVGEVMLNILEERKFPFEQLYPLASANSIGKRVLCGKKTYLVEELSQFDFKKVDIALFSAGGAISAEFAPIAAKAGCIVIDNTSHFRYEKDVPLIVPEVNLPALDGYMHRNIIANPNCSTIQLVMALKPIYDAVGIERINVATYQSVSGAGNKAVEELAGQTASLLSGQPAKSKIFPQQIAFNVIPQIDEFQENGYTREEMKMVWETQKILNAPDLQVNPTAVRVPVFYGHSEAVHIETRDKITKEQVIKLLNAAKGVKVIDSDRLRYPTVIAQASGHDEVFVGRIREDISHPRGICLWIVSDNLRKGAALNAIQIAEALLKR